MKPPDGQNEILELFRQGTTRLEQALAGLKETDLDVAPSTGGWTIRQIVHHIVDGDDIWKGCIKMALGNEQAEFTLRWYWALPQTEWASRWHYQTRSIEKSLALLKANRDHILQLLEQAPDGWLRTVGFQKSNGENERIPVGVVVQIQADHVIHHINRILAIRQELSTPSQEPAEHS